MIKLKSALIDACAFKAAAFMIMMQSGPIAKARLAELVAVETFENV